MLRGSESDADDWGWQWRWRGRTVIGDRGDGLAEILLCLCLSRLQIAQIFPCHSSFFCKFPLFLQWSPLVQSLLLIGLSSWLQKSSSLLFSSLVCVFSPPIYRQRRQGAGMGLVSKTWCVQWEWVAGMATAMVQHESGDASAFVF
jgi:hypothetical protein